MKQKSSQMRYAPWPVVQAALALAFSGLLLARPQAAAQGYAAGLTLCDGSLLPALFPLFVVCGLLGPLAPVLGWPLRPLMRLCGIRSPRAPAVLVEIGYHDNYSDALWLESHVEDVARQLVKALTEYFGLPFIEPQPVVQGTVSTSGSPLRLRAYPSAAGQTIALMPNGASVTIYGTWQGWNVVHYNGSVGYAAEAYIES